MATNFRVTGEVVREARKRKGLTQDTLAEMVDCVPAYISQIENGKKNPGIAILSRIAEALDISMDLITGNRTERWITEPSRAERILSDCSNYEYEMIIGIMERTKQLLRQNAPFMNLDER